MSATTAEASASDSSYLSKQDMWRNVIILAFAHAVLGSQMSMQFLSAGLVGQKLTPLPGIATLPVSALVLGSALSARPLARFMARTSRRTGFTLASGAGALGAAISLLGLSQSSFALFTLGTLITGIYMSAQGFYRFAAVDGVHKDMHGKVISTVMVGGLFAGIIGPLLANVSGRLSEMDYLGTYIAIIALNLIGPPLFAMLKKAPALPKTATTTQIKVTFSEVLGRPRVLTAMICALVAYALMNLVMTSTPLAMQGHGFEHGHSATVVGAHVLAMYAPSFFTGTLIARFSAERIVWLGMVLLAFAGVAALSGTSFTHFMAALVLLGVGWNFGYIGATAMLTQAQKPGENEALQGLNDAVVFGGVFVASLASGGLLNGLGYAPQFGWNLVNLAMIPFLLLAAGSLVWLARQKRIGA